MATGWFHSRRLFGAEGWWEELASLQGEGRFPREEGNRSLQVGRNSSSVFAFFRNPNTANSLRRRLLSKWDLGPFGKLSISAAGNLSWESDLRRLQSCKPRRLEELGKFGVMPCPEPWTGAQL